MTNCEVSNTPLPVNIDNSVTIAAECFNKVFLVQHTVQHRHRYRSKTKTSLYVES
jgi:hypothetical protein